MATDYNFEEIHKESGWHEEAIKKSKICGCFHCKNTFPPSEIENWLEESKDGLPGPGQTAMCPKCGIDAVLPESDKYQITIELLEAMNKHFF
jgi:hypothetical protein